MVWEALPAAQDKDYAVPLPVPRTIYVLLHTQGFSRSFLRWITSYLTGRRQFVQIDDYKSDDIHVTFGVPQESQDPWPRPLQSIRKWSPWDATCLCQLSPICWWHNPLCSFQPHSKCIKDQSDSFLHGNRCPAPINWTATVLNWLLMANNLNNSLQLNYLVRMYNVT